MKPRKLDKIIDSYQFIIKESAEYQYSFVFVEKDSYPDHVSGNIYSLSAMRTLQKFRENEEWMSKYYYPVEVERNVVVLVASEIGRNEKDEQEERRADKKSGVLETPFPGAEEEVLRKQGDKKGSKKNRG